MTMDQISKAMESYEHVFYEGGEYIITGVISRYGRQRKMTNIVPNGWWYEIELTDARAGSHSVVLVGVEDITPKRDGEGEKNNDR